MADIHPKKSIEVPRFHLESRSFRVITEGHFLKVVMPQCSSGPGTGPKSPE